MEMLVALAIGILTATGTFLTLRGRTYPVVLGLTLLAYACNLFIFSSGRLVVDGAAVLNQGLPIPDPLPQALVLTAIVIGFAMTAFAIILAMRSRGDLGSDSVDGSRTDREDPRENKA